jgi:large repetitive protein
MTRAGMGRAGQRFDSDVYDEGWWPPGRALAGSILLACLMAAAIVFLAAGPAEAAVPSSVSVTSSPNPAGFRQPITFTAAITPSTATGTVQFKIDGGLVETPRTVSGGTATLSGVVFLGAGSHTVVAEYSGDAETEASTGTLAGGQQVSKGVTTTTVTSDNNPSELGEEVTFTATVTPSLGQGTVAFKIDGETIDTLPFSGQPVELTVTSEGETGTSTVVAEYSGDPDYAPSSGVLPGGQVVLPKKPDTQPTPFHTDPPPSKEKADTTTKVTFGINSFQMYKAVTFHAAVTPAGATGTVQFKLDGKNLGTPVALSGGVANSAPVPMAPGNHTVVAEYSGDARFNPSSGVLKDINVPKPKILPRTGSSTVPLLALAAALIVGGLLIQRKANRSIESKLPAEDYRS